MQDEKETNLLWQAAALQNFDQAVSEHDYSLSKDIIEDTKEKGFSDLAEHMEQVLSDTPVENFAVKSHTLWTL